MSTPSTGSGTGTIPATEHAPSRRTVRAGGYLRFLGDCLSAARGTWTPLSVPA